MSTPIVIACHWMCRLCWIHILMVVMTILGLGLFGVSPALVVGCLLLRRYLNGHNRITISMVWTEYKKEFIRANKVGLLLIFVSFVFFFYYSYGINVEGQLFNVIAKICIGLSVFTLCFGYLVLVMMSVYDSKTVLASLQNGAILMRNYVVVGASILAFVATYLVEKFIPIIGLFYGYVPAFFTTVGT